MCFLLQIRCGLAFLLFSAFNAAGSDDPAFPPSADKSWAPGQLHDYEQQLKQGTSEYESNSLAVSIDPAKVYDLRGAD